eukprot:842075-Prymnesium_polylepis.1
MKDAASAGAAVVGRICCRCCGRWSWCALCVLHFLWAGGRARSWVLAAASRTYERVRAVHADAACRIIEAAAVSRIIKIVRCHAHRLTERLMLASASGGCLLIRKPCDDDA